MAGENFLSFHRVFKRVAGVFFADDVVFRNTPSDKEFARNPILIFLRSKMIDVAAGNKDWFGSEFVEAPGFVEPTKHLLVDRWKRDQTFSGNASGRQYHDSIVGAGHFWIDERWIAQLEWVSQDVVYRAAM